MRADREYVLGKFSYYQDGKKDNTRTDITAYIGKFDSNAAAAAAGEADVKEALFQDGYRAKYNNDGVTFSILVGSDGAEQKKYYYRVKVKEEAGSRPDEESNVGPKGLYHSETGNSVNYQSYYAPGTDGTITYIHELKKEYPLDGQYKQCFSYYKNGKAETPGEEVTAYVGRYGSAGEAVRAGAANIRDALFDGGYAADYSKGVTFSIFIGSDTDPNQKKYYYLIRTERYLNSAASIRRIILFV